MRVLFNTNKGIGLVEILITMFVLAVGVVGVAGLNSVITRQSLENKAQAEAQAHAQSRIEDARNYTNQASSLASFDLLYTPVVNGNSTPITGVNANFIRTETIADSGDDKLFQVNVAWTNADGVAQNVTLNTRLSYISPRAIGDTAIVATASTVNAPTGRASLGEGTVPDGGVTTTNEDGTALFEENGDLKLVECSPDDPNDCEQIVLTLANACQIENQPCTQFVRIKGKVYLNTSVAGQRPDPKDIFLVASDAAFCARYYLDGNGVPQPVTPDTTNVNSVGVYQYFNYTCYVGGGWHGNIGLIFSGNGNNPNNGYRGCTGDPTVSDPSLTPRVAIRRAYRGLLYKYITVGNPARVQKDGMDRLYSHGIHDGLELGASGPSHDFVIGKINDVDTDCLLGAAMTHSDATVGTLVGGLFEGQPRDFFCLNVDANYLDFYDDAKFGHDNQCPFDPTNPPSTKHSITGVIRLTAADTNYNDGLAAGIFANTSDGIACKNPADPIAPLDFIPDLGLGYYEADYSCDVYDWGPGWNGYVELTYDSVNMSCAPNKINYTALTSSASTGNDFTGCTPGQSAIFSGTVTQAGSGQSTNKYLTSITMTGTGASAGTNGTCTIAIGGLSYSCTSSQFSGGNTSWTGNLIFTAAGTSKICPATAASPKTFSLSNQSPGGHTQNVIIVANNGNGC